MTRSALFGMTPEKEWKLISVKWNNLPSLQTSIYRTLWVEYQVQIPLITGYPSEGVSNSYPFKGYISYKKVPRAAH